MIARFFIAMISFYRKWISPAKRVPTCRFLPTCSEYSIEVFRHRGAWVGFWLTLWRILRCHPFARGGYDPPPIHPKSHEGTRMNKLHVWIFFLISVGFWSISPVGAQPAPAVAPGGTAVAPTAPVVTPATPSSSPTPDALSTPVAVPQADATPVAVPQVDATPVAVTVPPAAIVPAPATAPAPAQSRHLYFTETPYSGEPIEESDPRLVIETQLFTARFTLQGAVFSSFILKNPQYREKVIPKEFLREKRREKRDQQMDLIKTWSPMFLPFQMEMEIEREAETLDAHSFYHVKREINFRPLLQKWELESRTDDAKITTLVFRLITDRPCPAGVEAAPGACFPVEIRKTYRIYADRYDLDLVVEVKNLIPVKLNIKKTLFSVFSLHEGESSTGFFNPVSVAKEAICYHADGVSVQSFNVIMNGASNGCMGCSTSSCSCQRTPSKASEFARGARWAGIDARYFLMVLVKDYGADDGGCRFIAQKIQEIPGYGLITTQMDMNGPRPVEAGQTVALPFKLYLGPKDLNYLDTVRVHRSGEEAANVNPKLNESVDFGLFWFIGKPMIFLLKLVQKVVINWGLAIILLTLLIKLVTLYWTNKSMRSMKKMASLKPEMDALQKKYANDKENLNKEIMALYKKHGVNPLGGCLPMLLQMPIYIAWYQALMASVELYRAPLFGWINDLTAQDPFFVLPILMGLLMFIQQKMTPTAGDNQQAKIMLYTMPIMFTGIMLFLPSGLTLYILTNTVLGLAHQWYMNHSEDARA
ncbi:membrane protein insertion efficiency factor YidD [Myxococcota bacterium]|nr:membrane protein insertion efficiency factor YidD [Myxococcota bacterium]